MFALGFWYDAEGDEEAGWSIEFITDDFIDAIENLEDAREDARNGIYRWFGAHLMIKVLLPDGSEEWQPMVEAVNETTDDTEDTAS